MRTLLSTSEPSIVEDLDGLSLSSASPLSADIDSHDSSDELIVVRRQYQCGSSVTSKDGSTDSSAVFVYTPGSPPQSFAGQAATSAVRHPSLTSAAQHPGPGPIMYEEAPRTKRKAKLGLRYGIPEARPVLSQTGVAHPLSETSASSKSASTSSFHSGGLGLSKKARQKRNRRLRREAERRESQRIERDYANHTSIAFENSDGEEDDSTSECSEGTEMTFDDAASSVDAWVVSTRYATAYGRFLRGEPSFMADPSNKLVFWQALCVELGLCQARPRPGVLHRPPSPLVRREAPYSSEDSEDSEDSDDSDTTVPTFRTARSITPKAYYPLPQSVTAAKRLLAAHAHVNLADFVAERGSGSGRRDKDYSHLVHPSAAALRRYTMETGKFIKIKAAKREWLQPLLKDFGFRRGRA